MVGLVRNAEYIDLDDAKVSNPVWWDWYQDYGSSSGQAEPGFLIQYGGIGTIES